MMFSAIFNNIAAGRFFSLGTPVSSTNKIDRHDITEILLNVAFQHLKPTNNMSSSLMPFNQIDSITL